MLKMWEQAQKDFAPYLALGDKGVAELSNKIPDYMAQVLAPQYNELMGFNYSPAQVASNYAIDPVTGQRVSSTAPSYGTNALAVQSGGPVSNQTGTYPMGNLVSDARPAAGTNALQPPQNATRQAFSGSLTPQSFEVPGSTERGAMINGQWVPESQIPEQYRNAQIQNPEYEQGYVRPTAGWIGDIYSENAGYEYVPPNVSQMIDNPNYVQPTTRTQSVNVSPTEQLYGYNALSPQYSGQYDVPDLSANLETGGVLSPLVPEFQRELNFEFNPNDPSYKIREAQKMEEINNFLAKQGLAGSTAGQSYMQRELDKFRAAEEGTQYNRALTERNYLTQTDLDKYEAEAARGNTLYGRVQGEMDTLYGRQTAATQTQDANRLNLLGTRLGAGGDIYSLLYGQALDATKIGSGASGSSGQSSMTTGSAIGQNAIASGNAQAQNALAQGQLSAQMWQGMAQQPYNALSTYQQFAPTNNSSYYSGNQGYAQPSYGNYGYLAGSGVTSAPIQMGATGNTAFGM